MEPARGPLPGLSLLIRYNKKTSSGQLNVYLNKQLDRDKDSSLNELLEMKIFLMMN
jgi:hypothetical protein